MIAELPEHESIISIFSDAEYMQGMYNQLLFIKAMQSQKTLN